MPPSISPPPPRAQDYSRLNVYASPLLATPALSDSGSMNPSPVSPADTLPPISPAPSAPKKLKGLKELGFGGTLPSIDSIEGPSRSRVPSRTFSPANPHASVGLGLSPRIVSHFDVDSDDEHRGVGGVHRSPLITSTTVLRGPHHNSSKFSPGAVPDIGKAWWNGVVSSNTATRAQPVVPSPPQQHEPELLAPTPSYNGSDEEEIDQLVEDCEGCYEQEPISPGIAPSALIKDQAIHYQLSPAGTYVQFEPHQYIPHPTPTHPYAPHSIPASPATSVASLTSTPGRRTKAKGKNVPLYNRSKSTAAGKEVIIFHCGYVPPRSTDQMAPQPEEVPCQTTALKKADMERHYNEIHAKQESDRVIRHELGLEWASRLLLDMANIVLTATKEDPHGVTDIPIGITGDEFKTVRNVDLRAQADNVRIRVRRNVPFSFEANRCMDFKDEVYARLPTYRVWRCGIRTCGKAFGSQRSLDRHCGMIHKNIPKSQWNQIPPGAVKRRPTRVDEEQRKRPRVDEEQQTYLSSPFASNQLQFHAGPSSSGPSTQSYLIPPPAKRARTTALPSPGPGPSTMMMRVRQQTPDMQLYNHGEFTLHMGLGLGSQEDPIKLEDERMMIPDDDEDVDEDLLELAEGGQRFRSTPPRRR